jgi:hypothetical protein
VRDHYLQHIVNVPSLTAAADVTLADQRKNTVDVGGDSVARECDAEGKQCREVPWKRKVKQLEE